MANAQKTAIVTGGSQGIGAALVLQPMGRISEVKDIVEAIVYLTEAGQVTGEVLHVDGGAHVGKW